MPFTLPHNQPQTSDALPSSVPELGGWWALLIVGCFYLVQAFGIFMVQLTAGFGIGFSEGLSHGETSAFAESQIWVLPLSLVLGTISAAIMCFRMTRRCSPPESTCQWLSDLIWNSNAQIRLSNYVLLGLGFGIAFLLLTQNVSPPSEDLSQPLFEAMLSSPLVLQVGWMCLIAGVFPLIEEVLFRGILYQGTVQSWGPTVAFVLTTVGFVLVHMPRVLYYWPAAVAVTSIGAFTLWVRIRTDSLIPGIVLHGTYNGLLVAAALLSHHYFPHP